MKLPNWLTAKTGGNRKAGIRKILLPALIASLLLFVASTQFVHAAGGIFGALVSFSGAAIGSIFFYISFIIAWIGGLCVGLMAWMITVMLGINNGVFQSVLVQTGFGVTLAIANLGFVLGIIIIAIATILHNNNYGIKQLLWKLVAAAILVNFSLVIMAPIFGFSNNVTQYFLNCINGGCNSAGVNNSTNFAQHLVGAFNPTAGFVFNVASTTITNLNVSSTVGPLSATGSNLGTLLVPIISVFFVAFECIMVVIVLATFVALLFMRYLYIAVLAILMPFAWLCWIFPNLNSHWKKWWAEFIRWTLFAPVVIFFLYLAILTQGAMTASGTVASQSIATYVNASTNPIFGNIATLFGAFFTPIITNLLNMFLMLGLSVAGLKVANDMGIKGADAGLKAAGAVKDGVVGYAGKAGKKGARLAYQKVGGATVNRALQEGKIGSTLKKIPVLGRVVPGGLIRRGESLAGRGLASVSTSTAIVEEAKKGVPKDRESVLANLNGSMNTEDTLAHLDAAVKGKYLKEDTMVNGKKAKDYLDQNRDVIKRFGQGKTLEDANALFFSNSNYRAGETAVAAKASREKAIYEEARQKASASGASKEDAKKAGDEAVKKKTEEFEKKAREAYDEEYEKVYNAAKEGTVGKEAYDKEKSEGGSDEEAETAKDNAAKKAAEKAAELAAAAIGGTVVELVDDIKDDFGKVIYKAGDKINAKELMDVSMKQFIKGLKPEDASKMDPNTLFGPAATSEAIMTRLENIAQYNAKLMPNLYKNMKFATIKNMQDKYADFIHDKQGSLKDDITKVEADASLAKATKEERIAEMKFMMGSLKKAGDAFMAIQKGSLSRVTGGGDDRPGPAPNGGGGGGGGGTK